MASSKVPLIEDRLLDDRELAAILGWNASTLSQLRMRGTLPFEYIRLGKRIRYRLSVVEAYLKAQTVEPKTAATA